MARECEKSRLSWKKQADDIKNIFEFKEVLGTIVPVKYGIVFWSALHWDTVAGQNMYKSRFWMFAGFTAEEAVHIYDPLLRNLYPSCAFEAANESYNLNLTAHMKKHRDNRQNSLVINKQVMFAG
ncbi:hypothetical protein chiPu_0025533 [Chiloscyllium punctatum]|uniref:Uncharacterized protein n=1 Tax=Chiloscyllium punctatum TaxID=137246 RepID=A0A401TGN3_CHIPU|nr:hypothetical protein [Chiloscyllium punctatum]